MKKVRKIYVWVEKYIGKCYACNNGDFYGERCTSCNGRGAHYKRVRILVQEEHET